MPAKKKVKNRETDRARDFRLLLYPDNPEHSVAIVSLKSFMYRAVGICHNQDRYLDNVVDTETGKLLHKSGDLKKEHFHFYVKFDNPRYIKGVADELGIESNLIQFADKSVKSYCEYILHWKENGKHQYETSELLGSMAGEMLSLLYNKPMSVQLSDIKRFIYNSDKKVNMSMIFDYCESMGYVNVCVRAQGLIKEFMYDYNERFFRDSRGVR